MSMLSRSTRAWSASSTVVLPVLTTCFGPRTAWAGLVATTWPVTSQSNSMRMAARCCLTDGFSKSLASSRCRRRRAAVRCRRCRRACARRTRRRTAGCPVIGHARVLVADGGGEEFQKAACRLVAGVGDRRAARRGPRARRRRSASRFRLAQGPVIREWIPWRLVLTVWLVGLVDTLDVFVEGAV